MQIVTLIKPSYTLVQLKGSFTYADRVPFKSTIDKAIDGGCAHLIVDLHEVNFLDSAALGILVLTHQRFQQELRKFGLLKPTEQCLKLLTIAGIHKKISIYQSEQEIAGTHAA